MLVPPHATVSASISSRVDAWMYKRRRLGVALVGTKRPSAVKRFRKLSVFRSRGHQGVLNSSSSRSSRLDDAHAPIGFLIGCPTRGKWDLSSSSSSSSFARVANGTALGRFRTRRTLISYVLLDRIVLHCVVSSRV